jgi:hypothetical protein
MRQTIALRTMLHRVLGAGAIVLAVLSAAILGVPGSPSASPRATSFSAATSPDARPIALRSAPSSAWPAAPSANEASPSVSGRGTTGDDGATSEDDGVLPHGVTVFDDQYPGIANLDGDLRDALRNAAADAADDGVELDVNSGWRSTAYQAQLLREAIAEYGSKAAAARWVATAGTSLHVTGNAVDIGPLVATAWLAKHGAVYGLCQIYRNEPWHYELRPGAVDRGCPAMYADPSRDPRLQP